MTTPVEAMNLLDGYARELDALSTDLAGIERTLEPATVAYETYVADYEIGLWTDHVENGAKFPPEALRLRLAQHSMPPEVLGRYVALVSSRKRIEQRLRSLKVAVDAQRSILSALKVEMEARGSA